MSKMKTAILILLSVLLVLSSMVQASPVLCSRAMDKEPLAYIANPASVANEINLAKSFSRATMEKLRQSSEELHARLSSQEKSAEYDFVCVGAGPACLTAALALPKQQRQRMLIVERTNQVAGTFGNADFFINTSTKDTVIAGADLPFSEFSQLPYPHSSQLAAYLQSTMANSGSHLLLNAEVKAVEMTAQNKGVRINIGNGETVVAKHLLLGTGLGDRSTKVQDPEYLSLFHIGLSISQKDPKALTPVMHSDSFLGALRANLDGGKSPSEIAAMLPKKIMVVGGGDGSRISLEGLAGLPLKPGTKLTWLYQEAKSAEQFVANLNGFMRYAPMISTLFNKNMLVGIEGRAGAVRKTGEGQLIMKDQNGVEVNPNDPVGLIIDATGYNPANKSILSGLVEANRQSIVGNADGFQNTVLGQQMVQNGQALPIFELGVSGGLSLTKAESQARVEDGRVGNPAAILNNSGRVEALMKRLLSN